mmetsp:Transcript_57652/g.137314  ORF Transcript_57652/g.137314 Transcript_57652/m.137314 type:complete len:256 (-) Transcript_57652:634-1401(-)
MHHCQLGHDACLVPELGGLEHGGCQVARRSFEPARVRFHLHVQLGCSGVQLSFPRQRVPLHRHRAVLPGGGPGTARHRRGHPAPAGHEEAGPGLGEVQDLQHNGPILASELHHFGQRGLDTLHVLQPPLRPRERAEIHGGDLRWEQSHHHGGLRQFGGDASHDLLFPVLLPCQCSPELICEAEVGGCALLDLPLQGGCVVVRLGPFGARSIALAACRGGNQHARPEPDPDACHLANLAGCADVVFAMEITDPEPH